jgi:hypothetical protein
MIEHIHLELSERDWTGALSRKGETSSIAEHVPCSIIKLIGRGDAPRERRAEYEGFFIAPCWIPSAVWHGYIFINWEVSLVVLSGCSGRSTA